MEILELIERISNGEDSFTQFKKDITNNTSLSYELMAFSNAMGGLLIIGVDDANNVTGLNSDDIRRLNQMIGSVIRDKVKPLIYPMVKVETIYDKKILLIEISKGTNKPYSVDGLYYTKAGSDKRKISYEELRRLFAESENLYADEEIVNDTNISDINIEKFYAFLERYNENLYLKMKKGDLSLQIILNNFNLMKNEKLTLAGNLIFGINPQKYNKSFYIDCCYYNGNNVSVNSYISEGRKIGSFETLYDETISFIKSNLQNRQVETNFNSRGVLEIDERVLGELIINAIMHRDYRINSAIKIFIFHNRVEIISPGKLTNSLTVEKIKQGISIKRNPILDSICNMIFVYTGRGSGIKRVLEIDPSIEFINDIDKEEFKCIIPRK